MFKHLIAFTGVLLFVSVLPGQAQNAERHCLKRGCYC